MSIAVTCPECNKSFRVKEQYAGKRGTCPHCKGSIQVPQAPGPEPRPAAESPAEREKTAAPRGAREKPDLAQLEQEVLGAFQGEIAPVRVSITYRFGILLVALLMVLLPLAYVGLIGLVGYLVYLHAVYDTAVLGMGVGRGRLMALIVYVAPLVVGAILVLFMIKPLFARPAGHRRIRSLTHKSDPLLFAFVDRVCAAVRAPTPKRIDVDCEVNASASYRRGLLSMLGSDLVLTIGMPLAAGLSARQFAGVLAHEFGHFSQGAGMRLTYLIRSISIWFTRVVYDRDEWDQWLTSASENSDWRIALILHLARFCVWLTRGVLWVLMIVGHVVSAFMLRQMEFDADRYEARLAGSDAFESTLRRITILSVAYQGAHADLHHFYQEGRLGDNLPRLVMANVEQMPDDLREAIDRMIDESTGGLLDTHPANRDRIANAHRENAPGIFLLQCPASLLFPNFDAVSRNVTWDFYRGVFGPQFKPGDMHPTDDLLARQKFEEEAGGALERFFQGAFNSLRPLPLPKEPPGPPADPKRCAAQVKAERQRMLDLKPAYDQAFAVYDQADTHTVEADQATAILKADLRVPPNLFSLKLTDSLTAAKVRRQAVARQEQSAAKLTEFEKAAAARLFGALELLHVPQVAQRIDNAEEKREQCARSFAALKALGDAAYSLRELRNEHASLSVLVENLEGNEENKHLVKTIVKTMEAIRRHLEGMRRRLHAVRYPLDHAKGDISIGDYMIDELPAVDDLGATYGAGQKALETLPSLYVRLMARLAQVAEEVERVLGLEPLADPRPKENAPKTKA
ncbi:MAG TPA: M48 family metalloprotease [Thermoguttaceae bacterium]|nr:M48 family metalloprotease [Thermoguttaceae bacterium]